MNEESVYDVFNEKRFAPSLRDFSGVLFDAQLQKEMAAIPEKLAFKIGEVADIARVKPYVLRYWETEFDQLAPQKSSKNQRVYLRRDVEIVLMIKKLLYRDRFSIEGARVALTRLKRESKQIQSAGGFEEIATEEQTASKRAHDKTQKLVEIRRQLEDIVLHVSALKQMVRF